MVASFDFSASAVPAGKSDTGRLSGGGSGVGTTGMTMTDQMVDTGPHARHGVLKNVPTQAMTGPQLHNICQLLVDKLSLAAFHPQALLLRHLPAPLQSSRRLLVGGTSQNLWQILAGWLVMSTSKRVLRAPRLVWY